MMEAIVIMAITLLFLVVAVRWIKVGVAWKKTVIKRSEETRFALKLKHLSELREKYKVLVLKGEDNDNLLSEIKRLDKELKEVCRKMESRTMPTGNYKPKI